LCSVLYSDSEGESSIRIDYRKITPAKQQFKYEENQGTQSIVKFNIFFVNESVTIVFGILCFTSGEIALAINLDSLEDLKVKIKDALFIIYS